jgi:hypothetical protein
LQRGSSSAAIDAGVVRVETDASAMQIDANTVVPATLDASAEPLVDAAVIDAPIDARARTPIDASRAPPIDARVAEIKVDAAAVQATGTGTVTFNNPPKGSTVKFVTIVLDGKNLGTTPIMGREVPAGHHEVQFVGVDRTETASFDLAPGEHKKITPPRQ